MVEDSARRNILHIKKINAFIKTYRNNIWEVIVIVMTTVKPWHSQQKKLITKTSIYFKDSQSRQTHAARGFVYWTSLGNFLHVDNDVLKVITKGNSLSKIYSLTNEYRNEYWTYAKHDVRS